MNTTPSPPQRRSLRWRPRSLRTLLLLLLLPGVLASLAYDSYNDTQTLEEITDDAYDQALRPPMRALERSLRVKADGQLQFDPPWYAAEDFTPEPDEKIHYRVQLLAGNPIKHAGSAVTNSQLLAGASALPLPSDWHNVADSGISFYDAMLEHAPVRVAAQLRQIHQEGDIRYLLMQVAQSRATRLQAEAIAWQLGMWRDARAVIVVAFLLWLGIRWGLQPLTQLRRDVAARRVDDTTPLDVSAVPLEVAPLVEAVNRHIDRHRRMLEQQSQFLADASHQLRTPLTVMLTQAEYAAREPDVDQVRSTLHAMIRRLTDAQRMTNQLLSLAQAQHAPAQGNAEYDLAACGRNVLIASLALADQYGIDLGWSDAPNQDDTLPAYGRRDGIEQAISNIVHNALVYTPRGGTVTLDAGVADNFAWLSISDDGPGIPAELRTRALERFHRLQGNAPGSGAGLGLAIARAFVERDGGAIELDDGLPNAAGGKGLRVTLRVPRSADQPLERLSA